MAALAQEFESLPELENELENELEGQLEGELEGAGELEMELEGEGEGELELEISPVRKVYTDAMMEHLGHMAAEAETEQEAAEQFLTLLPMVAAKLLPMVAKTVLPKIGKVLPRVFKAVTRVQPRLTRGIGQIARTLHRRPATRSLLKAVPSIARRTVHAVARQAAAGRPVTPNTAVRVLTQQAKKVLGQPARRAQVVRRSQILDRQFHRQMGVGMVRPHGAGPVAGAGYAAGAGPAAGVAVSTGGWLCSSCARPRPVQVVRPACMSCGQLLR
jgi:hypothetical protein